MALSEEREGKVGEGYNPKTSIPGATTADLDPHFVNRIDMPLAHAVDWRMIHCFN